MSDQMIAEMTQEQATTRRAFVVGLLELAMFLESHPGLPLPAAAGCNAFVGTKADLAAVARTGDRWEKEPNGDYFYLRRRFSGGHYYDINVSRDQVCRKVVTGRRLEPATDAREVEEYTWICDEPLLGASS